MGHRIAILGAGMSGMSCAHQLVTAGAKVTVFDKGRALGGRLATRLSEGWAFDHGAPSFHSKGTAFSTFMEHLVGQESARCIDPPGQLYKGRPHMHSLLTPLVQDLELYQSVEISEIKQTEGGWRLQSKTGQSFEQFRGIN